MRAALITELGRPPSVGEAPEAGESIEVLAAALNPIDRAVAAGQFYGGHPPLPFVPGCEFVGREAGGRIVWTFGGGLGLARNGGMAERAQPGAVVAEVPDGVDPALAAALGIAGLAGWLPVALRAPVRRGDRVLVLGATGAAGQVALQAAKLLGAAHVVAAGRDPKGLERALELDPNSAEAHASRGLTLSYHRLFGDAGKEFDEALKLDPTLYEAAYYYGRTLQAEGKHERSVAMYERAVALRPDDYQALSFVTMAYQAIGDEKRMLESARRMVEAAEHALSLNPGDSRALYLGASCLEQLGDPDRAQEWAERALQLDPHHPVMLYNIACFHAVAGRVDLALDHLERAMELGFHHRDWVMSDSDLESVRAHPRFHALVGQFMA